MTELTSSLELSSKTDGLATDLAAVFFPAGIISPYWPFVKKDDALDIIISARCASNGVAALLLEASINFSVHLQPMDVVPKPQPSVDEGQWEEKVKAYHLPRAEINKVSARRAHVDLTVNVYGPRL